MVEAVVKTMSVWQKLSCRWYLWRYHRAQRRAANALEDIDRMRSRLERLIVM